MKNRSLVIATLALSAGSSLAVAQTYQGSDTLEELAAAVTTACGESPALTYIAGGSSTGEAAMTLNTQDLAPMSRALRCSVVASEVDSGNRACAIHLANDAIALLRTVVPGTVAGAQCTNTSRDVLRQVYFGMATTGNGTGSGSTPTPDCGGTARRTLISSWASVVGDGVGCAGDTCTGALRHAFRRNDLSGTTDVFRDRLGIATTLSPTSGTPASPQCGALPVVPFCNGNDVGALPQNIAGFSNGTLQQDLDPVRTACSVQEDVCGPIVPNAAFGTRNLGVVLSIAVPTSFVVSGVTQPAAIADLFNQDNCSPGQYRLAPNPNLPPATALCPSGQNPVAGNCPAPVIVSGTSVRFNCLAAAGPLPTGSTAGFDGRTFNLILREANGALRLQPGVSCTGRPTAPGTIAGTRRVATAYYRIHTGGAGATPGKSCKEIDATLQIGCLVGADPCYLGYAGFAGESATNKAINVNGVNPLINPTTPNSSYLFFRKLWVNALNCDTTTSTIYQNSTGIGARGVARPEFNTLFGCFASQTTDARVTAAGFFPTGAAKTVVTVPSVFSAADPNSCAN